jgi:hypothetical protein
MSSAAIEVRSFSLDASTRGSAPGARDIRFWSPTATDVATVDRRVDRVGQGA